MRVQKSASGTTTVFIYSGSKDIAEYDNGAAPSSPSREFVYGNGQLLAEVSAGATTFYQPDHLSARMITNSSGSVLGRQGSLPFAESWYSSGGSPNCTLCEPLDSSFLLASGSKNTAQSDASSSLLSRIGS